MNLDKALEVIDALCEGVNPQTGELLNEQSCFNQPGGIRALHAAKLALERAIVAEKRKSTLPEKAGCPWSQQEDKELGEDFDGGMSVKSIASKHRRTIGAISSRLVHIGKIADSDFFKNQQKQKTAWR